MLLPESATLRPYFTAQFIICCTRLTFEANVAMIILLFSALLNRRSNELLTVLSDFVYPALSAFVESHSSASTPSFPSWPSLARSVISPWAGVQSILKSPVCTMTPAGECIAMATASGTEWFTWINSTSIQPSLMRSPGSTVYFFTESCRPCSLSLLSTRPSVNGVP